MKVKGLTYSAIFEAESANYGEGVGNVTTLKKMSRGTGESFSYISRQALGYEVRKQLGEEFAPVTTVKEVIQFSPDADILKHVEIDLFGYFKTSKDIESRNAVVRLSNAIALESFNGDLDYLTNKGLLDRYNAASDKKKDGGQIAQSEIHKSYYAYTVAIDLDKVGIDKELSVSNEEKARRVNKFLDVMKFLYRDIKGRRENLSPIFAIGGVYDIKNPFFENRLKVKNNRLAVETIDGVLNMDKEIKEATSSGIIKGIFSNDNDIINCLGSEDIGTFFDKLKAHVNDYYLNDK